MMPTHPSVPRHTLLGHNLPGHTLLGHTLLEYKPMAPTHSTHHLSARDRWEHF